MGRNSFVVDTIPDDDPEILKLVELAKIKKQISKERRKLKEKDFLNKHSGISKLYEIAKTADPEPEPVKAEPVKEADPEPVKEADPVKPVEVKTIKAPEPILPPAPKTVRADRNGRWF